MSVAYFEDSLHPVKSRNPLVYDEQKVIILSQMVKNFYERNESEIVFCNSNGLMMDEVRKGKMAKLVFIDLPVDNNSVVDLYISMVKEIIEYNMPVILIPIPCIEFYAVKAFSNRTEDVQIMLKYGLYKNTHTFRNNMSPKKVSFERFCKSLFSISVGQELRGSCLLSSYGISKELEDKLVTTMPAYYKKGAKSEETRVISLISKMHNLFNEQLRVYNENGYINKSPESLVRANARYLEYLEHRLKV